MQPVDDLPTGTRIYLSRKHGREVYDSELWLRDGQRIAWRTGQKERGAARSAARDHLNDLLGTFATSEGALTSDISMDDLSAMPSPLVQGASAILERAEEVTTVATVPPKALFATGEVFSSPGALSSAESLLVRFDRWFFGDLKRLCVNEN